MSHFQSARPSSTHIKFHEDVVLLLIANREFALRLLVRICKSLKLLDGLGLHHLDAELHVAIRVLMTRLK